MARNEPMAHAETTDRVLTAEQIGLRTVDAAKKLLSKIWRPKMKIDYQNALAAIESIANICEKYNYDVSFRAGTAMRLIYEIIYPIVKSIDSGEMNE